MSVPVLSVHSTLRLPRLSSALRRWTSVPWPPTRTAAAVNDTVMASTRPAGTKLVTMTSVKRSASTGATPKLWAATICSAAMTTMRATRHWMTKFRLRCSGVSVSRALRAMPVTRLA